MKNESFILKNNEKIADKLSVLDSGCTLINAPTGTGKTTFVLEQLTKQYTVLMLVPLVAQVNQLRETYKDRYDMLFLSGNEHNQSAYPTPIKSYQNKHIIATYDMWPTLQKHIDFQDYLLVIDEVHKLYSAGSYRAEALNPLFRAINNKKVFIKKLLLTATYTPLFGDLVKLTPDNFIAFSSHNAKKRQLTVEYYQEPWSYHWLKAVITRLKQRSQPNKIVFVRLNSNTRIEKAISYLQKLGYRPLHISRSTMSTADVKRTIEQEALLNGYDVILTTSIFDEAINLNNNEGEIDSVHIVDASAHPEELVQFMGRLRKANPPFFLHIPKKHDDFDSKVADKDKSKKSQIEKKYKVLSSLASNVKTLANSYIDEDEEVFTNSTVNTINTTMKNLIQSELLIKQGDKISVNTASIIADCYKSDIYFTYQRFDRLKERLEELLPKLSVKLHINKQPPCNILNELIEKHDTEQKTLALEAASTVCNYIKNECLAKQVTLVEYGNEVLESIENKTFDYPFDRRIKPHESNQYIKAIHLTRHLMTENDIERALKEGDYHYIVTLSLSYSHNILYNEIRTLLKLRLTEKRKITGPEAAKLVMNAVKKTVRIIPTFKSAIRKVPIQWLEYDDETERYSMQTSKAMNLIAKIADVKDVNSHKPKLRYLMLREIAWKGYNFIKANGSPIYEQILRKKEPKIPLADADLFA